MLQARAASRTGLSHAYRSRRPHLPAVLRHQSHVGSTPGPSARPLVQQRGLIGMFSRVTRLFGNPVVAGSEEGAPENLIPRDELGAALVAQDPKRRIRFHYPELFDGLDGSKEWSRNIRIRARMPTNLKNPDVMTLELLPFWTVEWLCDYVFSKAARGTRRGYSGSGYNMSSMGTAICAAPEGHWAHGLMLRESLLETDLNRWDAASPDINVLSIKADVEDAESYSLLPDLVDEAIAQPFAYGPPLFPNAIDQAALVDILANSFVVGSFHFKLRKPITAVAFPHYRLVYHGQFNDGRDVYRDVSKEMSFAVTPADDKCSVRRRVSKEAMLERTIPTFMYHEGLQTPARYKEGITPKLGPTKPFAIPPDVVDRFQELVVEDMRRHPISPTTWNNPAIFTFGKDELKGWPDMETARNYIIATLNGANMQSPIPLNGQTQKPKVVLFTPKPPSPKPQASQPKDQASGDSAKTQSSGESTKTQASGESAAQSADQPAKKPTAQKTNGDGQRHRQRLRAETDTRTSRERLMDERIKSAFANQRKWADRLSGHGKAKPAAAPSPLTVTDRRQYYAVLGMKPRIEFISPKFADKINDELKSKYHALTRKHHPDLAATPADEAKRHDLMSRINVAYDHVQTLAHRRHYHDPLQYPDPNKRK